MRRVTNDEIRRFYNQHYQLGPSTGFIFMVSPRVNVTTFLDRVSSELRFFYKPSSNASASVSTQYSQHGSTSFEPGIYKFPGSTETDPGEVLLAWSPVENTSARDLKLVRRFRSGLAGGERSILHQSLVDSSSREFDSGATRISSEAFVADSPHFAIPRVYISGIPGNRMSAEVLDHLRNAVLKHVREIYECADESNRLLAFNKTVASEAWSEHRSEIVCTKSPALFGDSSVSLTAWKSHLEHLEMDTAFIRFLSEEPAWRSLEEQLTSNQNLWRALIEKFHLLDTPYITA